jgi:hypothetical protein
MMTTSSQGKGGSGGAIAGGTLFADKWPSHNR